jgi:hypothetical protein
MFFLQRGEERQQQRQLVNNPLSNGSIDEQAAPHARRM